MTTPSDETTEVVVTALIERLATIIASLESSPLAAGAMLKVDARIARTLLAALNPQPRQVTTAEELATCGKWAVAIDACGDAWAWNGDEWHPVGREEIWPASPGHLVAVYGPLTVVFEGVARA